jgi:hypothetical protein
MVAASAGRTTALAAKNIVIIWGWGRSKVIIRFSMAAAVTCFVDASSCCAAGSGVAPGCMECGGGFIPTTDLSTPGFE